jgi:hypothetical protein
MRHALPVLLLTGSAIAASPSEAPPPPARDRLKDPTAGFTEGSPWTYLFGAMHDPPGMVAMLGGPEAFAAKLDENFDGGHCVHENEPGHHYAWLYDYAGRPWKTQERVRAILEKQYQPTPQGLKGDDDCGQMSTLYFDAPTTTGASRSPCAVRRRAASTSSPRCSTAGRSRVLS